MGISGEARGKSWGWLLWLREPDRPWEPVLISSTCCDDLLLRDSLPEFDCGANEGANVSDASGAISSHFTALSAGLVECVLFSLERAEPVCGVGEDPSELNSGSGFAVGEARCGWEVLCR